MWGQSSVYRHGTICETLFCTLQIFEQTVRSMLWQDVSTMFERVSPFQTAFASTTSVYLVLNKTWGFFRCLLPESFTVGKGVQNKIRFFPPGS